MAKFLNPVWESDQGESKSQLVVATILWLRTLGTPLDDQLGLANMIRLVVRPCNDLYFAEGIPKLPRTVTSTGHMIPHIPGISIFWTSQANAIHPRLTLEYLQYVSYEIRIHISWLEHALALAIGSLYNERVDWTKNIVKKAETIGGIELAEFLK